MDPVTSTAKKTSVSEIALEEEEVTTEGPRVKSMATIVISQRRSQSRWVESEEFLCLQNIRNPVPQQRNRRMSKRMVRVQL